MNDSLAKKAREIWDAGVAQVRADDLLKRKVIVQSDGLLIDETFFPLKPSARVWVAGFGKAGAAMAAGLEDAFARASDSSGQLPFQLAGWVNIPDGTDAGYPTRSLTLHAARPVGMNEPTERAATGTRQILAGARALQADDLCIALISGGGSALLPAPRDGITLGDKLAVTKFLSGAGANIEQLNTVRKQLSAVKGGRLLKACGAGRMVSLIVSDVLGDPLDVIASGPTVPDSKTVDDALSVLAEFDPQQSLPASVYRVLQTTQKTSNHASCEASHFVLANNATAVDAAGMAAERLGLNHAMQCATACEAEAESVGEHLAKVTLSMLRNSGDGDPNCLISGGEPIVRLADASVRGKGGRNQQLVLAALHWLQQHGKLNARERASFSLVAGGTDGEDGPTDAAGAMIDNEVWQRSESLGLSPRDFLDRNDAYTFFDQCGGLIRTGPTHTNVCDLRVCVVSPSGG